MFSIRRKITLLTLCEVIAALAAVTLLAGFSIRALGHESSNRILYLLCETGQKNLDSYLESVSQSVSTVSSYASSDLAETDLDHLGEHLERVSQVFEKTANNTARILTYYYRIDPAVSDTEKGFWFVNLDGEGFVEHEVTDITQYDVEDQSVLVWFTVPKATGKPVWLPPYVTDNLDVAVISYNVPIYKDGRFIGVIGIELDYTVMTKEVDHITLYDNGYAFINDYEGTLIYSPRYSSEDLLSGNIPHVPAGLLSESTYIRYEYDGVEKQAVWLPIASGLRLNVTVPMSEINESWTELIHRIIMISVILILLCIAVTMRFARTITGPLRALTRAATEVDKGNYEVTLDYDGKDEVGLLTNTFRQLIQNLKVHINELSSLAYADALTKVHNKGAFDITMCKLQAEMDEHRDETIEFAVGVFDCDNLKKINDAYGHDKGDIFLKNASALICKTFSHSPVFRIGGDEFAVLFRNNDYINREALMEQFRNESTAISKAAEHRWEEISVSAGIAVYDPQNDRSADDVSRRADRLMYEDKLARKKNRVD